MLSIFVLNDIYNFLSLLLNTSSLMEQMFCHSNTRMHVKYTTIHKFKLSKVSLFLKNLVFLPSNGTLN